MFLIYYRILSIIFFDHIMKKYQLWLERKSYSQHLFNLMKIKCSMHSPETHNRTVCKATKEQSTLHKYKEMQDYQLEAQKLGDISYAITYKELKNRKLRLMKSFEILNENMSMARRIKQVKSVFSGKDRANQTEYGKRRLFEKKCQLTNEQLREQNFRKFIRIQNTKANHGGHKFRLSITIIQAPRLFHIRDEFAAFIFEIATQRGVIRSEIIPAGQLQGKNVCFPLDQTLQKQGISSEPLGEFLIQRPELGEVQPAKEYYSEDRHLRIILKLNYNWIRRQKPSFTLK